VTNVKIGISGAHRSGKTRNDKVDSCFRRNDKDPPCGVGLYTRQSGDPTGRPKKLRKMSNIQHRMSNVEVKLEDGQIAGLALISD
jgi:hypothetical protein